MSIHRESLDLGLLYHKQSNGAVSVHYTQTQFDNGMKGIARQRAADMGGALGDKKAGADHLMVVKARR